MVTCTITSELPSVSSVQLNSYLILWGRLVLLCFNAYSKHSNFYHVFFFTFQLWFSITFHDRSNLPDQTLLRISTPRRYVTLTAGGRKPPPAPRPTRMKEKEIINERARRRRRRYLLRYSALKKPRPRTKTGKFIERKNLDQGRISFLLCFRLRKAIDKGT